jgi:hypothetical protein
MSGVSFAPTIDKRAFDEDEFVIYDNKEVRIVKKQEFRIDGGVYYLYRIQKIDGSFEPELTSEGLTATNGIPSTKFTKIENNLGRTDSNASTNSTGSMDSNPWNKDEPGGGAMTKNRKSKNRKSKNRKSKNRKSKNRKSKNRKSKNRKKSTYFT